MKKTWMPALLLAFTMLLLLLTACHSARMEAEAGGSSPPAEEADSSFAPDPNPEDRAAAAPQSFSDLYRQQMEPYAVNFSPDDMSPLDTLDLKDYRVFLIGESHAVGKNAEIKLSFFKYLNQRLGVRYIIEEAGYCNTIAINQFLQTGEAVLISELIESYKGTFGYTNERYAYYSELYKYNQTLPEGEKIVVIGIDVQHHTQYGITLLRAFAGEGEMSEPVRDVFDILSADEPTLEQIDSALNTLEANKAAFQTYLGAGYFDFYYGLRAVWQAFVYYTGGTGFEKASFSVRESFICDNFRDLYADLGIGSCFGMFGFKHVILNGRFGANKVLGNYLNTEVEATRDQVLSIMCIYQNCYYMDLASGLSVPEPSQYGYTFGNALAETVSGDYGICPSGTLSIGDRVLSDEFQYMLCVKNSPAFSMFDKR